MNILHSISGTVARGRQIGKARLDAPTANLLPEEGACLPEFGVYASRVWIDGAFFWGVTNIGNKPTIWDQCPATVETYVFDLDRDLYGHKIEVQLLAFLRGERAFDSIEALKEQIAEDKRRALEVIAEILG